MSSDSLRSLADEKYVSFVSHRRDGTPVATPVWIAPYGSDGLCFTTAGNAGKVRRVQANDRVTIQPCDMRGRLRPDTTPVEARARIVTGPDFRPVEAAVARKYGIQYRLVVWSGNVRELFRRTTTADCGVIVNISFDLPEPSMNEG